MHALPELRTTQKAFGGGGFWGLSFAERNVYLIGLAGLCAFYGLERAFAVYNALSATCFSIVSREVCGRWRRAFAFLAGGMILNVLKEELPEERESRFTAFLSGAAGYAALLLLAG